MGSLDPWVPSVFGDVPDKQKVAVPVGSAFSPLDDHSGILRDSDALSAAQAHLSGGSPRGSCGPLADVPGMVIAAAENTVTNVVTGAGPLGPFGPFGPGGVLAPEQLPTPMRLQEGLG